MTSNHEEDTREDVQDDEVIGQAFKWSLVIAGCIVAVVGVVLGTRLLLQPPAPLDRETEIVLPAPRAVIESQVPKLILTDITALSGIDWVHVSGMEGDKLLPETMGGGVAIFDYDQDQDQDLLFVGGTTWEWSKNPNRNPRSLCLYQNDGSGRFTDVTKDVGLDIDFYGMGPAVADYDNDGWPDLFVTAVGKNHLFRNVEGRFTDVSEQSGIAGQGSAWSTGATWLDYDRDGRLDLFVANYVVWARDLDLSMGFSLTGLGRAYGQPTLFSGTQSYLYHNDGDGHFSDVSSAMGVEVANPNTGVAVGKGLGVAAIDVDRDGWQDIVVSNDTVQNFLFMNMKGKGFEELAVPLGLAYDRSGNATGAMGIDCGYLRNNESLAIAIGNFANEQSSLYMSPDKDSAFDDVAMASGLGPMSRLSLTFGLLFADLDLDSRQDIVCSNGHLEAEIAKVQSTQQYEQPPQFFWNAGPTGPSEFVSLDVQHVGPNALVRMVGRGVASGDLDGDGDLDIVLIANSGQPRLLRNDQQLDNNWIRLTLQGSGTSNRDAIGALVTVTTGETTQRRVVTSTRSYLSQCEHALTFGLGGANEVDEIRVQWPSGKLETFDLPIDRTHHVVEGSGH